MALAPPRLALDIRGQAASLEHVLEQHCGAGRARLEEAAAVLRASRRIVVVGIGASLNAALALTNLLSLHGIESCAVEAGELLHYRRPTYQDATVVLISRSGESIEIATLVAALPAGTPILGVTNEPDSALGRRADVLLDVGSLPDEMVAIQSYTGTLLTLYLLGMATVGQVDAGSREVQEVLPALGPWTAANLEAIRDWDTFLEPDSVVYLLGRGPSYATALEGALLFGEIAKAPAIAMGVASFRHGPIEVVDRRFRAIVLAPLGRTRDLNIGLARDVVRFGGSVRLIGPTDSDGKGLPWISTPPCPEMLAPLLDVVPLQAAAMRMAQLRGVVVGTFRYITQVTRDERAINPTQAPGAAEK